jgi:hypothetical protein
MSGNQATIPCPWRSAHWLLATSLLAIAGCGDGQIATYPVTGTVKVNGKPAEGAMVIFVPTSTAPEAERKRPFGIADGQGQFSLMTFEQGDGAPAGEYKVLVQWPAPPNSQSSEQRGGGRRTLGADRLRGKYFNLEKATLNATVKEDSNVLPPFELQSG